MSLVDVGESVRGAVRLHPVPRRLLVGARRRPRPDPGRCSANLMPQGVNTAELQLLSRLARPRRGAEMMCYGTCRFKTRAIACGKPASSSVY